MLTKSRKRAIRKAYKLMQNDIIGFVEKNSTNDFPLKTIFSTSSNDKIREVLLSDQIMTEFENNENFYFNKTSQLKLLGNALYGEDSFSVYLDQLEGNSDKLEIKSRALEASPKIIKARKGSWLEKAGYTIKNTLKEKRWVKPVAYVTAGATVGFVLLNAVPPFVSPAGGFEFAPLKDQPNSWSKNELNIIMNDINKGILPVFERRSYYIISSDSLSPNAKYDTEQSILQGLKKGFEQRLKPPFAPLGVVVDEYTLRSILSAYDSSFVGGDPIKYEDQFDRKGRFVGKLRIPCIDQGEIATINDLYRRSGQYAIKGDIQELRQEFEQALIEMMTQRKPPEDSFKKCGLNSIDLYGSPVWIEFNDGNKAKYLMFGLDGEILGNLPNSSLQYMISLGIKNANEGVYERNDGEEIGKLDITKVMAKLGMGRFYNSGQGGLILGIGAGGEFESREWDYADEVVNDLRRSSITPAIFGKLGYKLGGKNRVGFVGEVSKSMGGNNEINGSIEVPVYIGRICDGPKPLYKVSIIPGASIERSVDRSLSLPVTDRGVGVDVEIGGGRVYVGLGGKYNVVTGGTPNYRENGVKLNLGVGLRGL
jgi:hypothetical protein